MGFDPYALDQVRRSRLLLDQLDEWIFHLIEPYLGARILEVGCGHGNMIHHLTDRELVVGVDIDQPSVDRVNANYKTLGNIRAYLCDVTSPRFLELTHHRFDTVVSVNVLEHIEDDELALQNIGDILSVGGRLLLVLPAHNLLFGTMDKAIGHYRRYALETLPPKLSQAGFTPRIQQYINPLGALGWFVNGRLLRRKVPPSVQLKMFNQLMPLVLRLQERLRPSFGLSLVCVSEKSGRTPANSTNASKRDVRDLMSQLHSGFEEPPAAKASGS